MKQNIVKVVAVILVIVVVLDLAAFVMRKISPLAFWISMAVLAFIAFKVIPRFNHAK